MKQHIDRRLVVLMLFVALIVAPWPTEARGKERDCKVARRWEYLLGSTALVFSFTPFAPVAVIYGVAAMGAKAYEVMYLDC